MGIKKAMSSQGAVQKKAHLHACLICITVINYIYYHQLLFFYYHQLNQNLFIDIKFNVSVTVVIKIWKQYIIQLLVAFI